jgi:hypothetical protein
MSHLLIRKYWVIKDKLEGLAPNPFVKNSKNLIDSNMAEGWVKQQSTGEKEPGYTSVIEWRGFLVSLVDAHFDYPISAATVDDIVQARTGISNHMLYLLSTYGHFALELEGA